MSKTEITKFKIDPTDPRELDKLKRKLKSKDNQRGVAGASKIIALALSPSVSPSRRTAKDRRQDLAAFVSSVEATVRSRLRALELPEEFTDLQKYLSNVGSSVERQDLLDDDGSVSTSFLNAVAATQRTKEWKRAYDLLCCLACIRNSRQLLKRREAEGVAVQAYYLGVRAAKAGVRHIEADRQQYRASQKEKAAASAETRHPKKAFKETARKAFEDCLKRHPDEKQRAYLAAKHEVEAKHKVIRSIRTIRRWLDGK